MRTKIIAGNWKMYKTLSQTETFFNEIVDQLPETQCDVIIAPSFTTLWYAVERCKNTYIEIAAQNMHQQPEGAYTGEVSASMLQNIGVSRVILGHSERREYFHETDEILAQKAQTALAKNFQLIFCVGEKWEDRKNKHHFEVVQTQLEKGLFDCQSSDWKNIIIAYEPVWAIGTGQTASPDQAQEMHQFIRQTIAKKYDSSTAEHTRILYGGSVKPDNARDLFSQSDIDGALVGGASLNPIDFIKIIRAAQ